MKPTINKWSAAALWSAISAILLGTLFCTASTSTSDIPAGEKVKVTGLILSRSGDTVRIKDKKSGQFFVVTITDSPSGLNASKAIYGSFATRTWM